MSWQFACSSVVPGINWSAPTGYKEVSTSNNILIIGYSSGVVDTCCTVVEVGTSLIKKPGQNPATDFGIACCTACEVDAMINDYATEAGLGSGLPMPVTSEIGVMTIVAETDLLSVECSFCIAVEPTFEVVDCSIAANWDVSMAILDNAFDPNGDISPIPAVNSLHNAVMLTSSISSECPDSSGLPSATAQKEAVDWSVVKFGLKTHGILSAKSVRHGIVE